MQLSDEEAAKEMQGLLEASVSALMPAIAETSHRFAQVSLCGGFRPETSQCFIHSYSYAVYNMYINVCMCDCLDNAKKGHLVG